MKKFSKILLIAVLSFSLALFSSCGNGNGDDPDPDNGGIQLPPVDVDPID